jgi:hypothetical protein
MGVFLVLNCIVFIGLFWETIGLRPLLLILMGM